MLDFLDHQEAREAMIDAMAVDERLIQPRLHR